MATSIRFPSDLPIADREGHGDTFEEIRSLFEPEVGAIRRRNRMRTAPRIFDLRWSFTQDDFQIFDLWWQNTIKGGELEFDVQLLDDDETLVWYTVRVLDSYRAEIVDEVLEWQVSLRVRALGENFGTYRASGTTELAGRASVGAVKVIGAIRVDKVLRGLANVGASARGRLNLLSMYGLATVGMYQLPRARFAALTEQFVQNNTRPVMEMGGVLYAANINVALSSTDDGENYNVVRNDGTLQVYTYGVIYFDALLGSQRISIGLNIDANFAGMIVGTDDPAGTTTDYRNTVNQNWYTYGHPRAGSDVIAVGALYSDDTYYYIVGRLADQSQTPGEMYLYRADTDLVFSLQGLLVQDAADPNELPSNGFGAFKSYWFTPNSATSSIYNLSSQLVRFSDRWFLVSTSAIYYTDDTDALIDWFRCPTDLGEGDSNPPTQLVGLIQSGSTLLAARSAHTVDCLSISTDNGETWVTDRPIPTLAIVTNLVAFGATVLVYFVDDSELYVAEATAPFTSWTISVVNGIATGRNLSNIVVTANGLVAGTSQPTGLGYDIPKLVYSADGVTYNFSTVWAWS